MVILDARCTAIGMVLALALATSSRAAVTLVGPDTRATVLLPASEPESVAVAVDDVVRDVEHITGRRLPIVRNASDCASPCLRVASLSVPSSRALAAQWMEGDVTSLVDAREAFAVRSTSDARGSHITIVGSDDLGTIYGLYAFAEHYLGVDPLWFWADRAPVRRSELAWDDVRLDGATPAVRFRGWFVNDEDLLTEWQPSSGRRDIAYPFYGQVVSPDTIDHVLEALLRLRMNLIIPASFVDIRNPPERALVERAARRGVYVSMHHVEPMGVSAFSFANYWKARGAAPRFSFFSSRPQLEETWRVYAREWASFPRIVWQVGLRGIADRPMWLADPDIPQSDADRGRLISDAMARQVEVIHEVTGGRVAGITTTLWAEGAVLHADGHLRFPPGVQVIFSDNSPGWRLQRDIHETRREPGRRYGLYYHHQLWGSGPHLVQIVPPARTAQVVREAVTLGAGDYVVMNVGNVREFVLGLHASAVLLRDVSRFDADRFLDDWLRERVGDAAPLARSAYTAYFDSIALGGAARTPILMDGQLMGLGLARLAAITRRLDGSPEPAAATREQQLTRDWASRSLGDMAGGGGLEGAALREAVQRQATGLATAAAHAEALRAAVDGDTRRFVEAHVASHIDILTGLTRWFGHVLEAEHALTMAPGAAGRAEAARHLRDARAAFAQVRAGQARVAVGRFAEWYRGDRKMHLARAEQHIDKTLARLRVEEQQP